METVTDRLVNRYGLFIPSGNVSFQREERPISMPRPEVTQDEDGYTIVVNAAGFEKDDVIIGLRDKVIEIKGTHTPPGGTMRRIDFRYRLSSDIAYEKISARLRNGELTIRLPYMISAKPRNIEIELE